jgi:hypothetical protein
MIIFKIMTLGKTLNNLRKTKESYFGLKKGTMINTDLLKKGLMVYYVGNNYFKFKVIDTYLELGFNKRYYKLCNKKNNIIETNYFIPYVMKDGNVFGIQNWVIKLCN